MYCIPLPPPTPYLPKSGFRAPPPLLPPTPKDIRYTGGLSLCLSLSSSFIPVQSIYVILPSACLFNLSLLLKYFQYYFPFFLLIINFVLFSFPSIFFSLSFCGIFSFPSIPFILVISLLFSYQPFRFIISLSNCFPSICSIHSSLFCNLSPSFYPLPSCPLVTLFLSIFPLHSSPFSTFFLFIFPLYSSLFCICFLSIFDLSSSL